MHTPVCPSSPRHSSSVFCCAVCPSAQGQTCAGNGNCDLVFDVLVSGSANWVNTIPAGNITAAERRAAEEETSESVKAALLISGADKRRYGKLKDELANNYLLGTNQYPDTLDKAVRILSNYQTTKSNMPFRGN